MRRSALLLLCLAGAWLAAGCSHYQLGTGSKLTFATLYVAPVANDTELPQAVAIVSTQLREALLRDSRIQLAASPDDADATLKVRLTRYSREQLTALATDTGRARKFGLDLTAVCTLTDRRSGHVLFADRPVEVTRQIFTDSGQLQAEYDAVPLLAQQLADRVAHAVLDTW